MPSSGNWTSRPRSFIQDGALLPGRGADLMLEGRRIGCFGELHPLVLRAFGLEQPIVALELKWGEL